MFCQKLFWANDIVKRIIEDKVIDNYDMFYITDLSLTKEVCELIDSDLNLKTKIKVFDHHNSNLFVNDYEFATVIDENEAGDKECGTSLFYRYLLDEYPNATLQKRVVTEFALISKAVWYLGMEK